MEEEVESIGVRIMSVSFEGIFRMDIDNEIELNKKLL